MSMYEALLSSEQSDNTTAYSTVSGLTLTPAAGTYLVMLTIAVSASAAIYTDIAIGVDGTEDAESERTHYHEGSIWGQAIPVCCATHAVVTVNGSEAIQARWKSSASNTRYAATGGLSIISIASGDATEVKTTSDHTTIGATPVKVTDFGTPAADEYLVVWSSSCRVGNIGDTVHAALYVDDTEVPHTERRYFCETSLTTVTDWGLMFAAVVTLSGSEEMSVRAWRTGASNATMHERNGVRIKGRVLLQVSDATTPDTESTSGTDKAIDDLTHVNPAAGDYMAIGTGVFSYGSIGVNNTTTLKLFEETTEVTGSNRAYVWGDSLDNMDMFLAMAQKVAPSGSEDVSLQWRGSTTDQRTCEERTFVLMLDAAAAGRELEGFRFRDDDDTEADATWLEDQDTNLTRGKEQNTRLRVLVDTDTADPPAEGMQLEYRKVGDPVSEWRKVPLP